MDMDEEQQQDADSEDESSQEESTTVEGSAQEGEQKVEEDKDDEEQATVPQLTNEQIAALAKDERLQKAVRGEQADSLQAFIKQTLDEQEQTKENEKAQAAQRQSLEDAYKALRENDDPGPLAQIAAEQYEKAREADKVSGQVSDAVARELAEFVEAVYGDTIKGMKPEEVKALDKMTVVDALVELDRRRADSIRGESASQVSEAEKAAQNAAAAAKARGDAGGQIPGGSAEEAVGDDIGTLLRQGLGENDPEYEEVSSGG